MAEYIERDDAIDALYYFDGKSPTGKTAQEIIKSIPAADVLPRDEAIKMGAELAAMHGSDATSQQLEEAYLKGVEDGMTRRNVRPVVRGKWIKPTRVPDSMLDECSVCGFDTGAYTFNYCPNCGAVMEES